MATVTLSVTWIDLGILDSYRLLPLLSFLGAYCEKVGLILGWSTVKNPSTVVQRDALRNPSDQIVSAGLACGLAVSENKICISIIRLPCCIVGFSQSRLDVQ